MDPPPHRPSIRSQEATSQYRDGKPYSRSLSRSRGQIERIGYQNKSLQKQRESEVFIPPFESSKAELLAEIKSACNPVSDPASATPSGAAWTVSHDGAKSVIQEVHKIILSDVRNICNQTMMPLTLLTLLRLVPLNSFMLNSRNSPKPLSHLL